MKPRFVPQPVRSISVLLPTFEGEEFLERVFARLQEQRCDLPWDVLVVDSGSSDRTLEILGGWRARLGVPLRIERIHNSAFDHGDTRNLLAAESTGDLLVFLTQDAIPSGPGWLAQLASNFADPLVGAAYCRNVARPDAQLLTRVFSENDPGYTAGRREVRLPEPEVYAALDSHARRLLYNFNDVASAIRRDVWERHPMPRTEFGEDVLMARALLEAGYTVVYDDIATVEHSHDYGPDEMRRRAEIDGKFNAEWLDRTCVSSRAEAEELVRRQLGRDREALAAAGFEGAQLDAQLVRAERLRRAAFVGLYEGGKSRERHAATRFVRRTRKKLLYVVHGFPPDTWAGTEVYTLGLAQEMQRRGHDVAVLARVPGDERGRPDFSIEASEFQGVRVFRMTNRIAHQRIRDSYLQPKADAAFRKLLLELSPDVVHFQHLIHMSAGLPAVCRELGIPTVVTVNDYWALCARVQLIRPDGVRCPKNQGLGCLPCIKGEDPSLVERSRDQLPPLESLVRALGSLQAPGSGPLTQYASEFSDVADRHGIVAGAYASCDLVIAPSRFLRERLLESGKFDRRRTLYSDYGTVTEHLRPLRREPRDDRPLRLGFVGSLVWYKGVDVLLRAMGLLYGRPVELHVFGDFHPERDAHHAELERLALDCGEAVKFHGVFDNRDIATVHERIDALVVPSVWYENSPITIHEAFLLGTPVITSDIGGMAELVRDGVDGLHFRVGDPASLAKAVARLLDEPGLLARVSRGRSVKTMAEDAREMEARYRRLCCIARERIAPKRLELAGLETVVREGSVDEQRGRFALLRPGSDSAVEYDLASAGDGPVEIEVELVTLRGEIQARFGGHVVLDGRELAQIALFSGAEEERSVVLRWRVDLDVPARRLRIDNRSASPHSYLRVARVTVLELPEGPRPEDAVATTKAEAS